MHKLRSIWLIIGLIVSVFVVQTITPPSSPAIQTSIDEDITAHIHKLAANQKAIVLSKHARERMQQRHFTLEDIQTTLKNGSIETPPRIGKDGEKIYKLEDEDTRGLKDGEVVVIPRDDTLFIVTVMWDGKD